MLQSMIICVIDWYHLYPNHPGGSILAKKIQEVCYWEGLVTQAELYAKPCNICQQFKGRKTLYGHLPPTNITELKPWDLVHVDLIGPYSKSIRQHHPGGNIIRNNFILTCMMMIDPATGWFEIFKIPTYHLDKVTGGNNNYIDKSYSRVSQMFNNTWISRHPRPRKVVFDNESEF